MGDREPVYHNFPNGKREEVLRKWREYKQKAGLEGDLYYDFEGKRRPENEVEDDIQALRILKEEQKKK